jgi:hypothetical protein
MAHQEEPLMSSSARYRRDPRWLTARFASACACGDRSHRIERGERVFYYPIGKRAYVGACAERNARDFESCVFDESAYVGDPDYILDPRAEQ